MRKTISKCTNFLNRILLLCCFFLPFGIQAQETIPPQHWHQLIRSPKGNYSQIKQHFETQKANKITLENSLLKSNAKVDAKSSANEVEYNQFYKWEAWIRPHLDSNGNFDLEKERQALEQYYKTQKIIEPKSSVTPIQSNWKPMGPYFASDIEEGLPTNTLGRVDAIAFHPTDINTFYVATPTGGVFKTIDAGKHWTFMSQTWDNLFTSALVVSPSNPSILYAVNSSIFKSYSNNLFKSTDAGLTWSKISNKINSFYPTILINQNDANNVLVGLNNSGVAITTDGGANWSAAKGITGTVTSLVYKPDSSSVVYAIKSDSLSRIYKSIDGGESFNLINSIAYKSISPKIATTAAAPNNIYLSLNGYDGFKVYVSTDGGKTFGTTAANISKYDEGQYGYCNTISISPTNTKEIILGSGGLYRSTDGGFSWNDITYNAITTVIHGDQHLTAFQPVSGKLFIGNDGGLYRSLTANNNFEFLSGINNTQIYRMSGMKNDSTRIIFGAQDNGIKYYMNGNFVQVGGGDGMASWIDPTNPNKIYFSSQHGFLEAGDLSKLNGIYTYNNFDSISPNPLPQNVLWTVPFVMDPISPSILYVGYNDVFKTYDDGQNWYNMTKFNSNIPITIIKTSESNHNVIYICQSGQVYRSVNGGSTWNIVQNSFNVFPNELVIDPNNSNVVWAAGYGRIIKTVDGGQTWVNYTGSFPNIAIICLAIDKNTHNVYLGTENGVFIYNDLIGDWIPFDTNLPKVQVNQFDINYLGSGKIRAATYGLGLWQSPLMGRCPNSNLLINVSSTTYPAKLSANAVDSVSYQWLKNGVNIVGATSNTYTAASEGLYSYQIITNTCTAPSNSVQINTPLSIVINQMATKACAGDTISIPFTSTGNFNSNNKFIAYLFDSNGSSVGIVLGENSPLKLKIPSNLMSGQYQIKVISTSPTFNKDSSTIDITLPIATLSTNSRIMPATLTANTGNALTYQWLLNGKVINSATNSTYNPNQAGSYSVMVTNNGCSAISDAIDISLVTAIDEKQIANQNTLLIYSNPSVGNTTIQYELTKNGEVDLILRNVEGKNVKNIFESKYHVSGIYKLNLDTDDLAAGIYFCTIHSENFTKTIKLSIVK